MRGFVGGVRNAVGVDLRQCAATSVLQLVNIMCCVGVTASSVKWQAGMQKYTVLVPHLGRRESPWDGDRCTSGTRCQHTFDYREAPFAVIRWSMKTEATMGARSAKTQSVDSPNISVRNANLLHIESMDGAATQRLQHSMAA